MVRVAVFTDNDFDKVNGVTTTLRALLRHAPADVAPRVYTAADRASDTSEYFAVRAPGLGLPWYSDMRVYWPRLRAFEARLREDGVDVVHLTTPGPIGLAGRMIARRMGLPITGSFHTNLGTYVRTYSGLGALGGAVNRYMRWLYSPCEPVLVPSEATLDELIGQGYPADRLAIWSRGVDNERFHPSRRSDELRRQWGVSDRRPALLYAGRLSREKGLDLLPGIQHQLASWGLPHRFVFVGDGPMASELRSICPDGAFLGVRPHDEVAVAMASADAFIFPSATDTLGNVVLEAQACGLPVVVSDEGGPREQMRDGHTGWIVRSGDAVAFADRLADIVRRPSRRQELSVSARTFALTRNWSQSLVPLMSAWRRSASRTAAVARPVGRDSTRAEHLA